MEDTTVICNMCEELFASENELRNHQQTVHAAEVSNRRRTRDNERDEDDLETAA